MRRILHSNCTCTLNHYRDSLPEVSANNSKHIIHVMSRVIIHIRTHGHCGYTHIQECAPTAHRSLLMRVSIHFKSCPSSWLKQAGCQQKPPEGLQTIAVTWHTCHRNTHIYTYAYMYVYVAMDISEQSGKVSVTSHLRPTWRGYEIYVSQDHIHCRSRDEAHQMLRYTDMP